MYYANSVQLEEEVRSLVKSAQPPLEWFCIDCVAVDDIDFSAAETLRALLKFMDERNIRLVLASVADDVKVELDRSGLTKRMDRDAYFDEIENVVDAFYHRSVNRENIIR
jgi:MFS superfamily sulfate permease-like transporter